MARLPIQQEGITKAKELPFSDLVRTTRTTPNLPFANGARNTLPRAGRSLSLYCARLGMFHRANVYKQLANLIILSDPGTLTQQGG